MPTHALIRVNGWSALKTSTPPREMPSAAADILRTLEAFGFEWDGEVAYQSRRYNLYQDTLDRLKAAGLVYPCYCSRKDWQAAATHGADGFVYNGRCRNPQQRPDTQNKTPAWRIQVPDRVIGFFRRHCRTLRTKSGTRHRRFRPASCRRLLGISACRGCRRCRSRNNPYCPRSRFACFHAAPNLSATMPRRSHTGLRTPSPIDQQPRAKMVETNPCPGFGFESKKNNFSAKS